MTIPPRAILSVALGSAFGGVLRYLVSAAALRAAGPGFPWGTLIVNVTGCAAAGAYFAYAATRGLIATPTYFLLMTGFLGGFTTFSAFGVETLQLIDRGEPFRAAVKVAANVGLGLAAVWVGDAAVRAWLA